MQKSILIVHPEGNINNNPNLMGIIEIFEEQGYKVDIALKKQHFYQFPPTPECRFFFLDDDGMGKILSEAEHWDLVIGVDAEGIVLSEQIVQTLNLPLGLISYEIFFENEIGREFKEIERKACRNVEFVVIQDKIRASQLRQQNHIPLEKFIQIPVSGRSRSLLPRDSWLEEAFNIPADQKIALFMGSVEKWSHIEQTIQGLANWPNDWSLVIHGRYGLSAEKVADLKSLQRTYSAPEEKLFFSPNPHPDFADVNRMVRSCDLGLVFYLPTYATPYHGNNLRFIGMSSGKLSTCLQNATPVAVNQIGEVSRHVTSEGLGVVVNTPLDLGPALDGFKREAFETNCLKYFKEKLNLDVTIRPLVKKLRQLLS